MIGNTTTTAGTTPARTESGGDHPWVDAAPFRAHLHHLMSVSGLSLPCVALLTGISPRLAMHLLYGRGGRALRRISPDTARKLLRVTPADARAVRGRVVPADNAVEHLRRLQDEGWSRAELAQLLGVPVTDLAALVAGTLSTCTQLAALRSAAEVALLTTLLTPQPVRARVA